MPLVRTVLVLEGNDDFDADALPVFAKGMPALFCRFDKRASDVEIDIELTLHGEYIPENSLAVDQHTTIIAYFFVPFAITGLFDVDAGELLKKPVALSNWSPHKYNALRTQLIYALLVSEKLEVLDHLLLQQQLENSNALEIIQCTTDQILYDPHYTQLSKLLTSLAINKRSFQRIFKKYVGVTPSQYRRICQFQGSFEQVRAGQFDKMSDVAFDNGFADQSHFIRSFKEFANTTPNEYVQNGIAGKK